MTNSKKYIVLLNILTIKLNQLEITEQELNRNMFDIIYKSDELDILQWYYSYVKSNINFRYYNINITNALYYYINTNNYKCLDYLLSIKKNYTSADFLNLAVAFRPSSDIA